MVAAREKCAGAGIHFVVGKVSSSNDPMRPSRLLFLCPDDILAPRVERLFHELPAARAAAVTPQRWHLTPPPGPLPKHLSATALRDYLACPFRFYLKWVLRMEQVDDRARELNPMQFGILCHEALEALGRCDELADNSNEEDLAAFLDATVTRRVARWFGRQVPVAVQVQIESARQRLRWAARVEAAERARGWRIISVESDLGTRSDDSVGRFPLRGRIDRLDQHREGAYRVLDYKTREKSTSPAKSHLRNVRPDTPEWQRVEHDDKEYEWVDLQLPLYAHFTGKALKTPISAGIFELPGAVTQTAVTIFDELTPQLVGRAMECAEAAANAIADWQFWPPRKPPYDDYEGLLGPTPTSTVEVDSFLAMLDERRQEDK
jgi:ATP-dependent helicase/nuclease subunit B